MTQIEAVEGFICDLIVKFFVLPTTPVFFFDALATFDYLSPYKPFLSPHICQQAAATSVVLSVIVKSKLKQVSPMGCTQEIDFLFRRTKASTNSNEIFQKGSNVSGESRFFLVV